MHKDWSGEVNVSGDEFFAIDVKLRNTTRFRLYLSGIFGRKDILRAFMIENGIKSTINPVLPKSYLLKHGAYKLLAHIRDTVIFGKHQRYAAIMKNLEEDMNDLLLSINAVQENIKIQEEYLGTLKEDLKEEKIPLNIITLQGNITETKNKIDNLKQQKSVMLSHKEELEGISLANNKNWKKQVELINNMVDNAANNFSAKITKKIKDKFDYNSFRYVLPDYSKTVASLV